MNGLLEVPVIQVLLKIIYLLCVKLIFKNKFQGAGHAFTALCSQPIPIGITCGRDGRRDCKLRLFSSDRKLERGKDVKKTKKKMKKKHFNI